MGRVVGIDLGTTNSAVSYVRKGKTEIVPDPVTNLDWTPSLVGRDPTGELIVGKNVEALVQSQSPMGLHAVKRFMGRRFDDEGVQRVIAESRIAYEVIEHPDQRGAVG